MGLGSGVQACWGCLMTSSAKHFKPDPLTYERYGKQGFIEVTQCGTCKAIGWRVEHHDADPCSFCGGKVAKHGQAMWVAGGLGNSRGMGYWKMAEARQS